MAASTCCENDLAVNGGPKTITCIEGKGQPTVGIDEFLELADTWGYGPEAQEKIKSVLLDHGNGSSPQLTRYYNPRPSKVDQLEALARELFGVKHALAVNSGTSALHAAYTGCAIGPGDEVIVPGYTFFATVAAVVGVKAIPVIAEIDDSLTIDPADVQKKITPRTKAIVPVHMAGCAADMDAILGIAARHKLLVIEDNAQSCGGTYKGRLLGTLADAGIFSLSSYKITGAGEAGLVLTNNDRLFSRAQGYHDTAACWRPNRFEEERWDGELFCGQNYRLSELEGAVNLVQLRKTRDQARRYGTNIRRVLSQLDTFSNVRPRRSNDPEGDVGYRLVLLASERGLAERIAKGLVAEGLGAEARGGKAARDWHLYAYWEHILERKTATEEGCPFTCPYYKSELPKYSADMCPRTLDLVDCAVFVNVDQWWTEGDCGNVAAAINKVCRVYG